MEKIMSLALVLAFLGFGFVFVSGVQSATKQEAPYRIHTLFSVECQNYFDWQTVGLMRSFKKARQPGPITRLLSCTDEEKKKYRGMHLAPTLEVPSMSRHPRSGDWYPAINKPAGVVHWLKHSKDAENVDWVVILDADMIIRGPIIPWELGAEKGRPVAALYGYLIGCDNILAKLHTNHTELCDKVGGLLAMHIDDLRALAPLWLSKTEEVREDRAHWTTNITGDIYGQGWISEMYGYSFGAAEAGLRHKIDDNLMIYPGYIPRVGVEPILLHYGLPFSVGNWSFSKLEHHEDDIVYDCGRLFPEPPYPREVKVMESDPNKRRALFLNLECINTLNEGLLLQHAANGCPKPKWSKYLSFLKSKTFAEQTQPKLLSHDSIKTEVAEQKQAIGEPGRPNPKIHTIFSTECTPYFDWQTVGLVHSFHQSGQPGNITRLLSCTDEDLKQYEGHDLAPTHYVPSMNRHPLTGDWYPAINKPAAVLHWLNHAHIDAEFIVILDADMIMRGPITPWEFKAERGRPVSTPYEYLIGCDNELAKLHTRHPDACDKVGGVIIMHIDDLRKFAMLWLHKTEEVRADKDHYARNITGDIYESGWISEMYGYSFGAAELELRHLINREILIYPGYIPESGVKYRVFHYGLEFKVGRWSFDKANWRDVDVVNKCWAQFPEPPDPSTLDQTDEDLLQRDLLSIECAKKLNEALRLHHKRRNCPDLNSLSKMNSDTTKETVNHRKFGMVNRIDTVRSNPVPANHSQDSSLPAVKDGLFSSLRFWVIAIWAFCGLGFLLVMYVIFSGRKAKGTRNKSYRNKRVHSLSIFDNGLYNCTAKNTEGVAFCSANVQVVELATPKSSTESLIKTESPINQRMKRQKSRSEQMAPEIIEALPHEAKAISGDQFIAECRVLGNPIPSICWLHNNTRITPNSDHIVLSFDGELSKLSISKISSLDSGRYIFIAENSSGTIRSEMNLLVNKAIREDDLLSPKFIESKVRLRHQIEIGDNGVSQREIVLLAEIIEGTEPITIKWFTPNRVEITNNHLNAYRIDRVGKDSRLTIFDAFPTDSGDYKCLAENKFGTAKCIFELKITEKNNFNYNIEQKPPTVSAKQSTIYAKQGQRFVDLIFSVFGDETVICWYRIVQDSEQHIIPNTKKYEANNKDNGQCVSLRIYDLQINDASQYKIVAINRCGEASGVIKLFVNTNINISENKKSAL